jgi:arylsulfatase
MRLLVNSREVAIAEVQHTVPFRYGVEPFDVGMDTVSSVTEDYKTPFPFQGTLGNVVIDIGTP